MVYVSELSGNTKKKDGISLMKILTNYFISKKLNKIQRIN